MLSKLSGRNLTLDMRRKIMFLVQHLIFIRTFLQSTYISYGIKSI
jgi:hypothetical protein